MIRSTFKWVQATVVVGVLTSCLSDQDPGEFEFTRNGDDVACAPGRVVSCACPGDADGVQECQDDGTFGACQCPGGGGQGGSSSGGSCTLFPDCDGCEDCFASCVCQSSGDVAGCQDKCSGGSGGAGGAGGAGGGPGMCVADQCPMPGFPVGSPCCTPGDACGLTIDFLGPQCIERDQPGDPDPDCPDIQLMGFPLSGCCQPGGTCGVLDTFLGLGCVDPSAFGAPPSPSC